MWNKTELVFKFKRTGLRTYRLYILFDIKIPRKCTIFQINIVQHKTEQDSKAFFLRFQLL